MIDSPKPMEREADLTPIAAPAPTDPTTDVRPVPVDPRDRRVLFLDDDPRRAEVFLHRCPQAVWVMTAEACIAHLHEPWDEVHLDHDLGGERFVDVNRDDCGMAVVRWLCAEERERLRDTRFFVHSYNFAAASLMVECLLRNGYTAEFRPFGFDLVDFLSFEPPPPPPPRRKLAWRWLAATWQRLTADLLRPRVTGRPHSRYDVDAAPAEEEPDGDRGSATTPEKEL